MILEIVLAIIIGVIAGTFTGLIPGIHTNLLATILLSISAYFSSFNPLIIATAITAMAITNTFVDFIPSIYLGAPDEETALSVMPGHEFLLKGRGHEAVILTLVGSVIATFLIVLITPLFIILVPKIYYFIEKMMSFILIWVSIFLISKEKKSKIWAILIFLLSGFLGIASLNLNIEQPLLPLLTGLFGSSTLIFSISKKIKIPKQNTEKCLIDRKSLIKPTIITSIISPICSFLPGLGSSQAAIIGSEIIKLSREQFLILLGSINTLVMSSSFLTLYLINKSRTGTAVAINQLINLDFNNLLIILTVAIISAVLSLFITLILSKFFAKNINFLSYSKISVIVLLLITLLVLLFSGGIGFLIFITSTILGLTCIYSECRKGFLMGSLIIPTIILYLPF